MKDLVSLHDHHVMASTLDDSGEEDQEVEMQTKELTQVIRKHFFHHLFVS